MNSRLRLRRTGGVPRTPRRLPLRRAGRAGEGRPRVPDFETTVSVQIWTLPSGTGPGGGAGPPSHRLSLSRCHSGWSLGHHDQFPVTNNHTINSVVFTGVGNLPATVDGDAPGGRPWAREPWECRSSTTSCCRPLS